MPNDTDRRFSDDEASRIWRRAAELQAARRLPPPADHDPAASGTAVEPGRLSGDEILAIGGEAGIDPEFVRMALTESEFAPLAAEGPAPLQTRRELDAPPAEVQAVLQEVAERSPFGLRLIDIRPAGEARVLVFSVAPEWGGTLNAGSLAAAPNVTALHALLAPGSASGRTEMILYGPPNPALPRAVRNHDLGFGAFGGLMGGGLGGGIAVELALTGAALVGPIALGALAVGGAGVALTRWTQRWARRKDAGSLEQLADETVGAVRIRRHAGVLPPGGEG